jgi:type IV secretory pathway VirB9-like protein
MPQVLEGFQKMPEKFYSIGEKTYEQFVQEYVAA